jgi:large subunit ribosomal protein L25
MKLLKASNREFIGKKVKNVRRIDEMPAVVYGPNRQSTNVQVNLKDFRKVYNFVGHSQLFDVELEGDKFKGILKEVQVAPVSGAPIHASIYAVDMNAPIEAAIPIHLLGVAPAVKNNLGLLETPLNELKIKCLPGDLPAAIEINVEGLANVGDAITLKDLGLSEKIEVLGDHGEDTKIVVVLAPQKMEIVEEEPVAEEAAEGAEGEAAATEVAAE